MEIVSRVSDEEIGLARLRDILDAVSGGSISETGHVPPGEELNELITQVDGMFVAYMETVDELEAEVQRLSMKVDRQDEILKEIHDTIDQGVPYDDELDHATIDMMEALVATGAFEPTFDGEISISEDVVISKEDIKPIVRQAIESWLRLKVR
jgi:hypothetical protein